MADIEIVIKIDEEQYEFIKQSMTMSKVKDYHVLLYDICERIKNGTLLPKGHGRIIDESQVTGTFIWDNGYIECYAPTIIEADKAESEE